MHCYICMPNNNSLGVYSLVRLYYCRVCHIFCKWKANTQESQMLSYAQATVIANSCSKKPFKLPNFVFNITLILKLCHELRGC